MQAPTPVAVEGTEQLVYEIHLTNFSHERLQLRSIQVLDEDDAVPLATFAGASLANRAYFVGSTDADGVSAPVSVAPGQRLVLYVEIACRSSRQLPRAIVHHIEYSVGNESATFEVAGGRTTVGQDVPIALAPPVGDGEWVAVHHPDWPRGHRRVFYALGGRARLPGRFAIDFVKINDHGKIAAGDPDVVSNSFGYGSPVLAVADAKVVAVRRDIVESSRVSGHPKASLDDAAGNYIVLSLGDRRFAFYEHLRPGSIRVNVGEGVKRGQVIAALGFTGESSAPHLHFHVADGSTPLGAEGIPFTFHRFVLLGHYSRIGELGSTRWEPLNSGLPATRIDEMPSANAVLHF
jgi:murein DD-endopeptidase